jgi:thymidylate synthase
MSPTITLIACVSKNLGIGLNGGIPWKIVKDLKHFKNYTINKPIVMGNGTFKSLNFKHLPNRKNIILSRSGVNSVEKILKDYDNEEICIIGGAEIYNLFLNKAEKIVLTKINKPSSIRCDKYFPVISGNKFKLDTYTPNLTEDEYEFEYLNYIKTDKPTDENNYLNLCRDVLNNGTTTNDRTNVGTLKVFGRQIRFSLKDDTLPLITTKLVAYKSCLKELLWFIKGDTDAKLLQEQGVKIWDGNSSREFLDNRGLKHYPEGVLGPVYGFNWRFFGSEYNVNYADTSIEKPKNGIDQLQNVIDMINTDPFSRRIFMTAWNPSVLDEMALPPCHLSVQFNVTEENGERYLSANVYQRSCDVFLGLPFNIASYSLLIYILAKRTKTKPGELIISLGDTHIYSNHIDQIKEQLKREPFPFPKIELSDKVKTCNLEDIKTSHFNLVGYLSHPSIKAPMAI